MLRQYCVYVDTDVIQGYLLESEMESVLSIGNFKEESKLEIP